MSHTVNTFCRNCTSMCGLTMQVSDDKTSIVSVRGDKQHPMTQGYHCIKALSSVDLLTDKKERLLHSLKRNKNAEFEKISADNAMDEIASRIQSLVKQYGPRSIALFYGTGSYFNGLGWPVMKSFLSELGSPNLFSTMTIDQSARWVSILRMGSMASGQASLDELDALMIIGKNPVISHQLAGVFRPAKTLADFKKRGAQLIVVDPRRTETAKHATHHLALKPGEDVCLLAGMIHLLLKNQWHDSEFCERFAGDLGTLEQAVAPYTSERVQSRCGINSEQLYAATKALATAKRAQVTVGTGPCMGPNSNLAVHLADLLNVLCGNFLREGDTVIKRSVLLPRRYQANALPAYRSWEHEPKCHSVDVGQLFGEFPTGALPDEILSPHKERIRALIVLGGNPVTALGQPEKTLKAFQSLDLLVCIDPRLNQTGQLADYIIAPPLQYERHDLSTVVDGTGAYTRPFVQYTRPVVPAPKDTIEEAHFFWGLAKRLGIRLTYKKMILGMNYPSIKKGWPINPETAPNSETFARWWCEDTEVDFDTLKASDSGLLVALAESTVQASPDNGVRLDCCPEDVSAELQALAQQEQSTQFAFRLICRRLLETMNSLFTHNERTRKRYPVNYVYMYPLDMQTQAINNEDRITISSAYGSIEALVRSDPSLQSGVLAMSHQWGDPIKALKPEDGIGSFSGRLVSLDHQVEAINRMPRQSAIAVNIERITIL
ncbi:MAG: molybdopterin-dependent oxidoreductase [Spongiibacteraceae bacterium]|nr:molybdopterin-dependent oxidoreductase [Spongiibacteraceae bacterium]